MNSVIRSLMLSSLLTPLAVQAAPKEICVYVTANGAMEQVNSREAVPRAYQGQARCFTAGQNQYLASPEQMQLEGTTRREDLNSPIGRVQLRWPRKVESLFGRTPVRAMQDAAQTVARALSKSAFPSKLQNLKLGWNVVFLDADLPETQVPSYLIANCHPGWMTPPSNIYIVAQRVVGGCGGQRVRTGVADALLTEVLVHEMGHAIEFHLLGGGFTDDRMRAEGFASWFEQYAAQYSSVMSRREIEERTRRLAQQSLASSNFSFRGSAEDYARASLYFSAIVDRRGLNSLMEVYETMSREGLSFFSAVDKRLAWNRETLEKEAQRYGSRKR